MYWKSTHALFQINFKNLKIVERCIHKIIIKLCFLSPLVINFQILFEHLCQRHMWEVLSCRVITYFMSFCSCLLEGRKQLYKCDSLIMLPLNFENLKNNLKLFQNSWKITVHEVISNVHDFKASFLIVISSSNFWSFFFNFSEGLFCRRLLYSRFFQNFILIKEASWRAKTIRNVYNYFAYERQPLLIFTIFTNISAEVL